MFGKIGKAVLGVAATAGATAINPALGAIVGSSLGGGAVTKAASKHFVEKKTGARPHKVAAPLAAVAAPAAVVSLGGIDTQALCDLATQICASPMLIAVVLGALGTFLHQLVNGAGKLSKPAS